MNYILLKQLDDALKTEKAEIDLYAKQHGTLPEIVNTNDQQVLYHNSTIPVDGNNFLSQIALNNTTHKEELMRQLSFSINVGGNNYNVVINKSQEETDDVIKLVVLIATSTVGIILLASYIINQIVLKRLWHPFYKTIEQLEDYRLQKLQPVHLPSTNVQEFSLLNETIKSLLQRIEQDYRILKDFTGNAAHEMQTPLAIISNQVESIMQDEVMIRTHQEAILNIEEATKRLAKMNQSLLLLAKIENRHFTLVENVDWHEILNARLHELLDIVNNQQIEVIFHQCILTSKFHQQLADILVTNLLTNAIKYNCLKGKITITVISNGFTVANTSYIPELDAQKIFSRFYRHPDTEPEGYGLGLSIVQQICLMAAYKLTYQYKDNMHCFKIELC
jgi:signal transduction histidine kinase